jgi:hypothetical protein
MGNDVLADITLRRIASMRWPISRAMASSVIDVAFITPESYV